MRILWSRSRWIGSYLPHRPHQDTGGRRPDRRGKPRAGLCFMLSSEGCSPAAVDPVTGKLAPLFDPRRDAWQSHFRWLGVLLVGMTPSGRATVSALDMNRPLILAIRREKRLKPSPPNG